VLVVRCRLGFVRLGATAAAGVVFVVLPLLAVESMIYGRLTLPPLNILLYNVLGVGGDSTLYGTEAWWFYLANLAINFNLALVLALALPAVLVIKSCMGEGAGVEEAVVRDEDGRGKATRGRKKGEGGDVVGRGAGGGRVYEGKSDGYLMWWLAPVYLWVLFFSAQAHKEERFMFVVYPLLAAAGGICLVDAAALVARLLGACCHMSRSTQRRAAELLVTCALIGMAGINLARILTLTLGFAAPIKVWTEVGAVLPKYRRSWGLVDLPLTVCVGKEWYRFPSRFLVDPSMSSPGTQADAQQGWNLGYIKSLFDGQLPSQFLEQRPESGDIMGTLRQRLIATRHVDPSFNSFNRQVMSRYVDISECHFIVDRSSPVQSEVKYENDHVWHVELEVPFLVKISLPPPPPAPSLSHVCVCARALSLFCLVPVCPLLFRLCASQVQTQQASTDTVRPSETARSHVPLPSLYLPRTRRDHDFPSKHFIFQD
jgi:alpha-1,2-mannosyltransferase